jgi:flavodoxin I
MKVKIVYSTQSGTTEYISKIMVKCLEELGHTADKHCANTDGSRPALKDYDVVIFGSPTYDFGQLEEGMARLTSEFKPDLSQTTCVAFAVGDSSFPHYCGAAEHLEEWIKSCSGQLLVPTLKIDSYRQDYSHIPSWIKSITEKSAL